jgi:hypothetical protein
LFTNGTAKEQNGKVARLDNIVRKFKSKYGEGEVKKYHTKFDVAAEVPL